jgi:hypothetical protein
LSVNEDGAPSYLDLGTVFDDLEDSDSQLTYTVTSNSKASLFSNVSTTGTTLTLAYTPDAYGTAHLVLRATDSQGAFVETTFDVNVLPVNDVPILLNNMGAAVIEDETVTLSEAMLQAFDIDNVSTEVIFTLMEDPLGGSLKLASNPLRAGASFTQDDIDRGLITYTADEDGNSTVEFKYRLSDAEGADQGTHVFAIQVSDSTDSEDLAIAFIQEESVAPIEPIEPIEPEDSTPESINPSELVQLDATTLVPPPISFDVIAALFFEDSSEAPAETTTESRHRFYSLKDHNLPDRVEITKELETLDADLPEEFVQVEIDSSEEESSDRITEALQQALDELSANMDEAIDSELSHGQLMMAVGHIGGASLSAGVLAWIFRAGSLLASVLSVTPLWTRMDPLPVLLAKKRDDDEDEELDEAEAAAARILDGSSKAKKAELSI